MRGWKPGLLKQWKMGSTQGQKMEWLLIVFGGSGKGAAEHGLPGGAQVWGVKKTLWTVLFVAQQHSAMFTFSFHNPNKKMWPYLISEESCLCPFLKDSKGDSADVLLHLSYVWNSLPSFSFWIPLHISTFEMPSIYASPELSSTTYLPPCVDIAPIPLFLKNH